MMTRQNGFIEASTLLKRMSVIFGDNDTNYPIYKNDSELPVLLTSVYISMLVGSAMTHELWIKAATESLFVGYLYVTPGSHGIKRDYDLVLFPNETLMINTNSASATVPVLIALYLKTLIAND